jgi:hypothetical protein
MSAAHGSAPHGQATKKQKALTLSHQGFAFLAEWTGLEPATPGVTGRYSNQLNYHSAVVTTSLPLSFSIQASALTQPSAVKLGDP